MRSAALSEIGHRLSVSGRPVNRVASAAESLGVATQTSDNGQLRELPCARAILSARSACATVSLDSASPYADSRSLAVNADHSERVAAPHRLAYDRVGCGRQARGQPADE